MSWPLVILLATITYASRAAALVFLPQLPDRVRMILDRMPPLIFAGLAAQTLVAPGGGLAEPPLLAAAAGALVAAPFRSFLGCLVAGVAAYFVWVLLIG